MLLRLWILQLSNNWDCKLFEASGAPSAASFSLHAKLAFAIHRICLCLHAKHSAGLVIELVEDRISHGSLA